MDDRSSAIPQRLAAYAQALADINTGLGNEARMLHAALTNFSTSCTEFGVGAGPHLADLLQTYVQWVSPTDQWVGQVAQWFLLADSSTGAERDAALVTLTNLLRTGPPATPSPQPDTTPLVTKEDLDKLEGKIDPKQLAELRALVERYETLQRQGQVSASEAAALREELNKAIAQAVSAPTGEGGAAAVAAGAAVASGALLADDATVIGVVDDPLIIITGAVAIGAAIWAMQDEEERQAAQEAVGSAIDRLHDAVQSKESSAEEDENAEAGQPAAVPDKPTGSLTTPSASFWKQRDIDPEQEKKDIVGEHGSKYDLHVDKNNYVWIKRKGAADSDAIPLGPLDGLN